VNPVTAQPSPVEPSVNPVASDNPDSDPDQLSGQRSRQQGRQTDSQQPRRTDEPRQQPSPDGTQTARQLTTLARRARQAIERTDPDPDEDSPGPGRRPSGQAEQTDPAQPVNGQPDEALTQTDVEDSERTQLCIDRRTAQLTDSSPDVRRTDEAQ